MLTDVAALSLALMAAWFSARPATSTKTFGYHRLEILAALVNGVALVVISLLIFYEAYRRWAAPPAVRGNWVILFATGGLIIHLASARILHGQHEVDLNIRGRGCTPSATLSVPGPRSSQEQSSLFMAGTPIHCSV
jgi:cobalt-zinc-cadmium efflux system protein